MSSSFGVYPRKVKRYKTDAEAVHKRWISYNAEINSVMNNLGSYSGYSKAKRRLRELYSDSSQDADSMKRYIRAIEEIIDKYESTERRICDGAVIDELKWETLTPSVQYTPENLEMDDSWWDWFKDFYEGMYTWIPKWLRPILLLNPVTRPYALMAYILENDYLKTAFWQALGGDFEDDSNMLGALLSVIIGFIPIVGTIADIRDLIADIYNLIDDGPQTSEWVDLGFTAIGLIPALGDFLKHGDEVGDFLKGIFKNADAAKHIDEATDAMKHAGNFVSGAVDKVDDFKKAFNEKTIEKIMGPLKDMLSKKLPDKLVDALKKALGKDIAKEGTVKDFLKELISSEINEATGIPTSLEDVLKALCSDSNNANMQQAGRSVDPFAGITRANAGFSSAFA